MEKDNPAKITEAHPITFESEMKKFQSEYGEVLRQYPLDEDEDLLGQHCDMLRKTRLPVMLGLAKSRIECQRVLIMTTERNTELRAIITAKMETFKPQQPKK